MSSKSKSNRKFRSLKMESLENRELMAADTNAIDAYLKDGTLTITGTNNGDYVRVLQLGNMIEVRDGYNSKNPITAKSASAIKNLYVDMQGGSDKIEISVQTNLDSVFLQMGQSSSIGSFEDLDLHFAAVRELTINADKTKKVEIKLSADDGKADTDDIGKATISLGKGDDWLNVVRSGRQTRANESTRIKTLTVNTSDGNDHVQLTRTSVNRAEIYLGAGDDIFTNMLGSDVSEGIIDGGSAIRKNSWRNAKFGKGVAVRGF